MHESHGRHSRSRTRSRSRSPVRERRSRSRSPRRRRNIQIISKRVYISNIPYDMKWQDIKDLFRNEVGEVAYVELFEGPDGKPRGTGVVEFKDKDAARDAIEKMHRYKVKDRYIVVREERESDRMAASMGMGPGGGGGSGGMGPRGMGPGPAMGPSMGPGAMGPNMGGNMMGAGGGMNNQLLQQLNIDGPLTNTVFVANLDYKVTWRKLKDVFQLAGNVIKAEIKMDKEGKSRGMGTVQFEHPMEAVQAISMFNGQTLYDRNMVVRMDKVQDDRPPVPPKLPSGLKSIGMGLGVGGAPLANFNAMGSQGGGMGGMSNSSMGMGSMGMGNMGGGMGSMGGMGTGMGTGMGDMGMGMGGMGGMGSGMNAMGALGSSSMSSTPMGMSSAMGGGMGSGMSGGLGGGLSSSLGSGMSGGMSGMSGSSMGMGMGMSSSLGGAMDGYGGGMGSASMAAAPKLGGGAGLGDGFASGMGMGGGSSLGSGMMSSSNGLGGGGLGSSGTSGYGGDRDRGDRMGNRMTRPDNCTIIVKNLPYSFTWQNLRERFRDVGEVKYAEIKTEGGRSTGVGLVRFANQDDCQRAISLMNRVRVEGREMDVRLYRG